MWPQKISKKGQEDIQNISHICHSGTCSFKIYSLSVGPAVYEIMCLVLVQLNLTNLVECTASDIQVCLCPYIHEDEFSVQWLLAL